MDIEEEHLRQARDRWRDLALEHERRYKQRRWMILVLGLGYAIILVLKIVEISTQYGN